jgi:hypothetical protein
MPEVCIIKMTDLQETKFLCLFGSTNVHYQCSYAQMQPTVPLCTAAPALRPSGVTYIPLFYVVTQNISDYANMLIRPSVLKPST